MSPRLVYDKKTNLEMPHKPFKTSCSRRLNLLKKFLHAAYVADRTAKNLWCPSMITVFPFIVPRKNTIPSMLHQVYHLALRPVLGVLLSTAANDLYYKIKKHPFHIHHIQLSLKFYLLTYLYRLQTTANTLSFYLLKCPNLLWM